MAEPLQITIRPSDFNYSKTGQTPDIGHALETDPDTAARNQAMSRKTDMPLSLVNNQTDAVEKKLRQVEIEKRLAGSPVTTQFMSNPLNAQVSTDAVESLTALEQTWKTIGDTAHAGALGLKKPFQAAVAAELDQQFVDSSSSFGELLRDEVGSSWVTSPTDLLAAGSRYLKAQAGKKRGVNEKSVLAAYKAAADTDKELSDIPFSPSSTRLLDSLSEAKGAEATLAAINAMPIDDMLILATELAGRSLSAVVPAVAATVATGNPIAGVATMGGMSYFTERYSGPLDFLKKQGVDINDPEQLSRAVNDKALMDSANQYGITRGTIIAAVDTATGGLATKVFGSVVQNLIAQFAIQAAGGGIGEAGAEAATGEELDYGNIFLEMLGEISPIGAPVDVYGYGRSYFRDAARVKDTEVMVKLFDQVMKEYNSSPLTTRDPERAAEHLAEAMKKAGIKEFFIPGDAPSLTDDISGSLNLGRAVELARETGGAVAVSARAVARILFRTPAWETLKDDIKLSEAGLTVNEAKEVSKVKPVTKVEDEEEPLGDAETLVKIAEEEMGMQAILDSGQRLGMTPSDTKKWLVAKAKAVETSVNKLKVKLLKDRERQLSAAWIKEEAEVKEKVTKELAKTSVHFGRVALKNGIPIDDVMDLYNLNDLAGFRDQLANAPSLEDAATTEARRRMETKYGTLTEKRQAIRAAIESIHNDDQEALLELEINQLRDAKKEKRVSRKLYASKVRERLDNTVVGAVDTATYLSSETAWAKRAGKLIKEGNRKEAKAAKVREMYNHIAARQSVPLLKTIQEQTAYISKFFGKNPPDNLPIEFFEEIQNLLRSAGVNRKRYPANAGLTVAELRGLYEDIREQEHFGKQEKKFLGAQRKRDLDETIATIIETNAMIPVVETGTALDTVEHAAAKIARYFAAWTTHPNTVVAQLDGYEDRGVAYRAIIEPMNRAIHSGYDEGQIGYYPRMNIALAKLKELSDFYTVSERDDFHKRISVPGTTKTMTKNEYLSLLANLGNRTSIAAVADGGLYTEQELLDIAYNADKRDMDYTQARWDFVETYWPDIHGTTRRRRNRNPKAVEAVAVENQHGMYRGGYYPLRYTQDGNVTEGPTEAAIAKLRAQVLDNNGFIGENTNDGHTKTRKENHGKQVYLDLSVLDQHIKQVIYDLEVGDAVRDVYKVVMDKQFQGHLFNIGHKDKADILESWIKSQVTQGVAQVGLFGRMVRYLHKQSAATALMWNVMNGLVLQYTGVFHAAATTDRKYVSKAFQIALSYESTNGENIFDVVQQQSGAMQERYNNLSVEISDINAAYNTGWFMKYFTDNEDYRAFVTKNIYVLQKTTQRHVDTITWLAAKLEGLDKFEGDDAKATEYADQRVVTTQGSGEHHQLSAIERGDTPEGDIVGQPLFRAFGFLGGWAFRKQNILRQKFGKYRHKRRVIRAAREDALQIEDPEMSAAEEKRYTLELRKNAIRVITEGMMLVLPEAIFMAWLYGDSPDLEDDDPEWKGDKPEAGVIDWAKHLAKLSFFSLVLSVPIARDFVSSARGFPDAGGGLFGSTLARGATLYNDIFTDEDEFGVTEYNRAIRLLGQITPIPVPANLITNINNEWHEDDPELWNMIFGRSTDEKQKQ